MVITLGIWGLMLVWSIDLSKIYLYKKTSNIEICTHLYIQNKDLTIEIISLKKLKKFDIKNKKEVYLLI